MSDRYRLIASVARDRVQMWNRMGFESLQRLHEMLAIHVRFAIVQRPDGVILAIDMDDLQPSVGEPELGDYTEYPGGVDQAIAACVLTYEQP